MAQAQQSDDSVIERFLASGSAPGILLMAAAVFAIVMANSPLESYYNLLIDIPVQIRIGDYFEIDKPLLLWVNDGLMALFFLLVGLELKREVLEGELSDPKQVMLPALGAIGGMAIPAAVYIVLNLGEDGALEGWAIPAATDIAFALGVLSLLGKRVPVSLKVFLTSLAIFDDVGAVVIIAIFYTSNLSTLALLTASSCLLILFALNRRGVIEKAPFLFVGLIMWAALLKSGVHATLAGIALAMMIPMRDPNRKAYSPVKRLEHDLHGLVSFMVLPVFAFCNAGLNLNGVGLDQLLHPVPLGIAAGLFIGKQIGVFAFCAVGIRLGWARMPEGMGWMALYGVALLCGIGFTMSLFIGSLAFEGSGVNMFDERLGILIGSLFSGVAGVLVLHRCLPKAAAAR